LVNFFVPGLGKIGLELFVLELPVKMGDPSWRAKVGEQLPRVDTLRLVLVRGLKARPGNRRK